MRKPQEISYTQLAERRAEDKPVWSKPKSNRKNRAAESLRFAQRFPGKGKDRLDSIGMA